MCGRFYVEPDISDAELAAVINEVNGRVKTGEVFPGDRAAVIAPDKRRSAAVFAMKWGFTGPKGLIINARSETAAEKPLFADGFRQRRCVIPATSYYEWENAGGEKRKYAFYAPLPLRMAGLYRIEGRVAEFVILTRPAPDSIAFIHDRMPVLLPPEGAEEWLSPEGDARRVIENGLVPSRYETA